MYVYLLLNVRTFSTSLYVMCKRACCVLPGRRPAVVAVSRRGRTSWLKTIPAPPHWVRGPCPATPTCGLISSMPGPRCRRLPPLESNWRNWPRQCLCVFDMCLCTMRTTYVRTHVQYSENLSNPTTLKSNILSNPTII